MNRYVTERLMTVEEAMQLSANTEPTSQSRGQRPSIWAWQTVEGVLAQTVSDEQVERMLKS